MPRRCRYASFDVIAASPRCRRGASRTIREMTMPKKTPSPKLDRRKFLTAAAVAGAAGAVNPAKAATATTPEAPRPPSAVPPNAHVAAAEAGVPDVPPYAGEGRPGSDFMVDVIKSLDIKYMPSNPASSYRAIHESLIDYGKNT